MHLYSWSYEGQEFYEKDMWLGSDINSYWYLRWLIRLLYIVLYKYSLYTIYISSQQ